MGLPQFSLGGKLFKSLLILPSFFYHVFDCNKSPSSQTHSPVSPMKTHIVAMSCTI